MSEGKQVVVKRVKAVMVLHQDRCGDWSTYIVPYDQWDAVKLELHKVTATECGCPGGSECTFGIHPNEPEDANAWNGGDGAASVLRRFEMMKWSPDGHEDECSVAAKWDICLLYSIIEAL